MPPKKKELSNSADTPTYHRASRAPSLFRKGNGEQHLPIGFNETEDGRFSSFYDLDGHPMMSEKRGQTAFSPETFSGQLNALKYLPAGTNLYYYSHPSDRYADQYCVAYDPTEPNRFVLYPESNTANKPIAVLIQNALTGEFSTAPDEDPSSSARKLTLAECLNRFTEYRLQVPVPENTRPLKKYLTHTLSLFNDPSEKCAVIQDIFLKAAEALQAFQQHVALFHNNIHLDNFLVCFDEKNNPKIFLHGLEWARDGRKDPMKNQYTIPKRRDEYAENYPALMRDRFLFASKKEKDNWQVNAEVAAEKRLRPIYEKKLTAAEEKIAIHYQREQAETRENIPRKIRNHERLIRQTEAYYFIETLKNSYFKNHPERIQQAKANIEKDIQVNCKKNEKMEYQFSRKEKLRLIQEEIREKSSKQKNITRQFEQAIQADAHKAYQIMCKEPTTPCEVSADHYALLYTANNCLSDALNIETPEKAQALLNQLRGNKDERTKKLSTTEALKEQIETLCDTYQKAAQMQACFTP